MSEFPGVDIEEWRERVERELHGKGLDGLAVDTLEGLVLAPLYARAARDPGHPGVPPYVRGSRPAPEEPPWVRWQRVDEPDLGRAVERIEADRAGGVDGLWLRFDRSVRSGLDPEAPAAAVGDGVVATGGADLERLLRAAGEGPLALRLDAGANALPVAASLFGALERVGGDLDVTRVHLGMDPVGALAGDGGLPASVQRLGREAALLARRAAERLPNVRALAVDTAPYARAGADAVQQLAFAMSTAVQYLRWLEEHGVAPEQAVGQLEFRFETDRHFLLEVAKLRAARLLWARLQGACGVEPVAPWLHASTGWRTLTRQDPWTNLLRVSVQATAAIVGGADSLSTAPFDARLGRPDALGNRLARNTQAILAEESGLGWPIDPAGGAYAVERVTRGLAAAAWERLQALEGAGGVLECLRNGSLHDSVGEAARRRADRIHAGEFPLLGRTHYPPSAADPVERPKLDLEVAVATAGERLRESRAAGREPELEPLEAVAGEADPDPSRLGEALMAAVRSGATFAELGAALRQGATPAKGAPLLPRSDEDLVPETAEREVSP